jgi:hypothetical protein
MSLWDEAASRQSSGSRPSCSSSRASASASGEVTRPLLEYGDDFYTGEGTVASPEEYESTRINTELQALLIQHRSLGQALQRAAAALGTPGDGAKLRDELHDLQGQADEVCRGVDVLLEGAAALPKANFPRPELVCRIRPSSCQCRRFRTSRPGPTCRR